jgi:AraC family transcriptional regulator
MPDYDFPPEPPAQPPSAASSARLDRFPFDQLLEYWVASRQSVDGESDSVIRLISELLEPVLDGRRMASEAFARHLLLAMREHVELTYGNRQRRTAIRSGTLASWQERRATEYMLAHIEQEISLEQIAAQCRLSVNHFVRAFRQTKGETPHRWLMQQRVEKAMRLIRDSGMSIADVAAACGFSDQSHLTRVFAASLGTTPHQWRVSCGLQGNSQDP